MLNNDIVCFVVGLLFCRSPPTIAGLVVAQLIRIPIKRVLHGWARPHVFTEGIKTTGPPLTHFDSPRPVPPIACVPRIIAALNHLVPNRPNRHGYFLRPSDRSIESIAFARADVQNALMVVPRAEQKLFSLVWKPTATRKLTCSLSGSVSGTLMVMVANNLEINV